MNSASVQQHPDAGGQPVTGDVSALRLTLRALEPLLSDPEVTEVCINRPQEVFVETASGWRREALPVASFDWCRRLAKLVANSTRQRVDESSPLLSASLPGGERIQVVLPPATTQGCVAITIRRPSDEAWSITDLCRRGIFRMTRRATDLPDEAQLQLLRLLAEKDYEAFMRLAVVSRKNILVSGATGSGKTTWTKALIREIPPEERLVTIEDAQELVLDRHANHVRLFYSKDGQGLARVTPKQLLESCLRMKPDRILLAELRAEGSVRLPAQRQLRPSRLHHQRPCRQRRARFRAVGVTRETKCRRPRAAAQRHQESPVYAGRCRNPVRNRAS